MTIDKFGRHLSRKETLDLEREEMINLFQNAITLAQQIDTVKDFYLPNIDIRQQWKHMTDPQLLTNYREAVKDLSIYNSSFKRWYEKNYLYKNE